MIAIDIGLSLPAHPVAIMAADHAQPNAARRLRLQRGAGRPLVGRRRHIAEPHIVAVQRQRDRVGRIAQSRRQKGIGGRHRIEPPGDAAARRVDLHLVTAARRECQVAIDAQHRDPGPGAMMPPGATRVAPTAPRLASMALASTSSRPSTINRPNSSRVLPVKPDAMA
jgi:hypothetical protein